jgi:hypothetical protein
MMPHFPKIIRKKPSRKEIFFKILTSYSFVCSSTPSDFQTPIGINEINMENCQQLWSQLTSDEIKTMNEVITNGLPSQDRFLKGFPEEKPEFRG